MISQEVITIESGQKPKNGRSKSISPTRILVPVDSSGDALNSLAYTLRLAKAWNAGLHLYYVINIDDIPYSESAVVVEGAMNRLEAKATSCLESLKEIIQETGVEVVSAAFEMGKVRQLLNKRIHSVKPELIVTGRNGVHKGVLKYLVRKAICPVLIVPEAPELHVPSSVLLLNDQEDLVNPLDSVDFVLKKYHQLNVLTTAKRAFQSTRKVGGEDPSITVHSYEGTDPVMAVERFVQEHVIDLVCVFLPKQSFLQKIFKRFIPFELAWKLDVPVLVIQF